MAAGGAAGLPSGQLSRIPASWLQRAKAVPGSPGAVQYKATYAVSGTAGAAFNAGAQAIRVKGPGTLNSMTFTAVGLVTVGFQIVSIKGGQGAQVVSLPSANVNFVSSAPFSGLSAKFPAQFGSFVGAWTWPIQEIINNGQQGNVYAEECTAGTHTGSDIVSLYAGSQPFTALSTISFSSAFANGYTFIVALGSFTQGAATLYYASLAGVSYSIYAPVAFDDELIINISPSIVDSGPGQAPFNSVATVSVNANLTVTG